MQNPIRKFSALIILGSLSAFVYLAFLPGDVQNNFLNLSPLRLLSLAGIFAILCASIFIFFRFQSADKAAQLTNKIKNFKSGIVLSFFFFTVSLTVWNIVLCRESIIGLFSEAVYIRLAPLMLLGSLVCFGAGIVLLLAFLEDRKDYSLQRVWKIWILLLGGFAVIATFIFMTGIGFTFDNVGLNWGPVGTPLTFAQVNLVLSIGFLLSFLLCIVASNVKYERSRLLFILDVGVFLALWGLAILLWSNQTISPSHFSPAPSAPNYEYYPYSDAAIFDRMSYHLLSGIGFSESLIRRPLYVALVALFHKIGGSGYEETVFVQIVFLALIPSFIYLLTVKLSNRLAGFLAGGLIVLREMNAISLSGRIVTSHAKLIMSDLTAMLGIVVFVYACIILLKKTKYDNWLLLVIGASLGLLALVRAQSLILVPLILLYVLIPQRTRKPLFMSSTVILFGIILVIAPWVWRNWHNTGMLALGDSGEKMLMARNYSLTPIEYPQPLSGETTADFSSRLSREILSFMLEHPGNVAFFVSNHFMHSLATSVMYIMPAYTSDTPQSLVSQNPLWDIWDGSLGGGSFIVLLVNLTILAFGISLAQKDYQLAGWYPLLVFVVYQAGNALARTSGWRFALPVDWILLVYFCIALSHLPSKITLLYANPSPLTTNEIQHTGSGSIYPAIFLFLFFIGISLPITEKLIPDQKFDTFTGISKDTLIEEDILTSDQFTEFLEQKNAVFASGIALYPRFYKPDGDIYLAGMPEDFRYLHFWLLNEGDMQIILPMEKPPHFFPHHSMVSVLGCTDGDYISAWAVVLKMESGSQVILQEPANVSACP